MGLILIILWLGALAVIGLPGLGLGIVVSAKSQRDRAFWFLLVATALLSVAAQYVAVLAPFVRRGAYSWDLVLAAIFGWQLLVPAVLAVALWLVGRRYRQSAASGAAAGLFLSIPSAIALAVPFLFAVPSLFHLKFEP